MAEPKERPDVLAGETWKVPCSCGTMYITLNIDEHGNLFEVFNNQGKSGGCQRATMESICRLISISLRSGIDVGTIIKQLEHIRCPNPTWGRIKMTSCVDGIAVVLKRKFGLEETNGGDPDKQTEQKSESDKIDGNGRPCPECGNPMTPQGGCWICNHCGYDLCG